MHIEEPAKEEGNVLQMVEPHWGCTSPLEPGNYTMNPRCSIYTSEFGFCFDLIALMHHLE